MHRGRSARRKSIALKEEKKRERARSALEYQKKQRKQSEKAEKPMSRNQLKAPGLAVMSVEAKDSAAMRIQKIQRRRLGRRHSIKKKEAKRQQRQHNSAAIKVQKVQRGRADRRRAHQVRETKFAAATKIQSHARGNIIRKQVSPVKIAASPYNQKRSANKPVAPLGSPSAIIKEGVSRGARVVEASGGRAV